jgi:hypothetical protein
MSIGMLNLGEDPSWVNRLELTTMRKAAKWQIYLPLMRSVRIIVFFVPMNLPLGLASQEGSGLAEPVSDLLCSTEVNKQCPINVLNGLESVKAYVDIPFVFLLVFLEGFIDLINFFIDFSEIHL